MKRSCFILMTITAIAVLLLVNSAGADREDVQPPPPDSSLQPTQGPDGQESIKGYPHRERRIGGPTDVEWDLDHSFPKQGSVLELILKGTQQQDP